MGLFSKAGQPIIYKESSDAKEYLKRLEELYLKVEGSLKDEIDKEMKIVRAGIVGEDQILYELRNSGMDMYVLHDIFLESGESSAQIDFYVITPQMTFIIECKNLFGNIEIDNKGNFIRTLEYNGRRYKEGIYSPITQNERHLQVIKNILLEDAGLLRRMSVNASFDRDYHSLVVLANPKTVLNDRYAKKEMKEKVIRADNLIMTMKEICRDSGQVKISKGLMEKLAQGVLERNVEQRKDYLQKYEELLRQYETSKTEQKETEADRIPEAEPSKTCPGCGGLLVKRKGKYGEFYGCERYPYCRYTEKIDRSGKREREPDAAKYKGEQHANRPQQISPRQHS